MPQRCSQMSRKRRRQANGEGSVYVTSSGQWKVALTVRVLDGSRRRVIRNAQSQRHGKGILAKLKEQFCRPITGPSKLTIPDLLESWLENVPNRKPATLDGYRRSIRRHIRPHFEGVKIQDLTALAVADWSTELRKRGVGNRSQAVAFSVLSMAFNYARDLGLVESNPCARVKRPRADRKEPDPFTLEEVQRILESTREHRLHALFQLALTTGMRQGELFGLQWDDLDLEAGVLSVKRQCVEHGGTVTFSPPKTKAGIRSLTLTEATRTALMERRALAMKEGFASSKLVFLSPQGRTLRRSNFRNRVWDPLLAGLEIRHRGIHQCRHTVATMLLKRMTPIHVVSKILGHAKPSITHDIYAHFQPGDSSRAAEAMADIGAG